MSNTFKKPIKKLEQIGIVCCYSDLIEYVISSNSREREREREKERKKSTLSLKTLWNYFTLCGKGICKFSVEYKLCEWNMLLIVGSLEADFTQEVEDC